MSDPITDAMIEAVAVALRNQARERVGLSPLDRLPWSPASGEARADARDIIEVVAPLIAAQALRDAADSWRAIQRTDDHLLRQWLTARAARIERGES